MTLLLPHTFRLFEPHLPYVRRVKSTILNVMPCRFPSLVPRTCLRGAFDGTSTNGHYSSRSKDSWATSLSSRGQWVLETEFTRSKVSGPLGSRPTQWRSKNLKPRAILLWRLFLANHGKAHRKRMLGRWKAWSKTQTIQRDKVFESWKAWLWRGDMVPSVEPWGSTQAMKSSTMLEEL